MAGPKILATPIKIGKKTAPNRLVNHPMECNDADEFGNPTNLTHKRYKRLAEGGAGIITVEFLADPLFGKKVFAGNIDKMNYCTACGGCTILLKSQTRVGCTIHDPVYKEELRRVKKEEKKNK